MLSARSAGMPTRARRGRDLVGRHALVLVGSAPRSRGAPARRNCAGKPSQSLVASMPTISTSGRDTRSSRSPAPPRSRARPRHCARRRATARCPAGASATSWPCVRRCIRAGQSALARPGLDRRAAAARMPARAQRRDRDAGIVELVAAVKLRRRQVEQARLVLIDEAAAFFASRIQCCAGDMQRRARPSRPGARSPSSASRGCGAITAGTPRLKMPAFSAAIFSSVSPRNSMWSIDTGVMTLASGRSMTLVASSRPPRPTSSSSMSAGMAREQQKAGGGLDLEHRDRRVAVGALAFGQRVGELRVGDQHAAARPPIRKRSLKRTRWGEV